MRVIVTISASPSRVKVGQPVTVSGRVTVGPNPVPGPLVTISHEEGVTQVRGDQSGNYSTTITFSRPGTKTITARSAAESASTTVVVEEAPRPPERRVLRIQSLSVSNPTPKVGERITVSGNVVATDLGPVPITVTADGYTERTSTDEFGGIYVVLKFDTPGRKTITVTANGQSASVSVDVQPLQERPPQPQTAPVKSPQDVLNQIVTGTQNLINQAVKATQDAIGSAIKSTQDAIAQATGSLTGTLQKLGEAAAAKKPGPLPPQRAEEIWSSIGSRVSDEVLKEADRIMTSLLNEIDSTIQQVPPIFGNWGSVGSGAVSPPAAYNPNAGGYAVLLSTSVVGTPVQFACKGQNVWEAMKLKEGVVGRAGGLRSTWNTVYSQLVVKRVPHNGVWNFIKDMVAQGKEPTEGEIRAKAWQLIQEFSNFNGLRQQAEAILSDARRAVRLWQEADIRIINRSIAAGTPEEIHRIICGGAAPSPVPRQVTQEKQSTVTATTTTSTQDKAQEEILRREKDDLIQRLKSARDMLNSLDRERIDLEGLISRLRQAVDHLRGLVDQERQRLEDLRARAQQAPSLTRGELESRISALRAEISQLQDQLAQLRAQEDILRAQIFTLGGR
ncbi:MAG: hypothetical protein QXP81_09325 [Nitrososphaerota archaeon]